jgi:class 3 adenylate cyclase
VNDHWLLCTCRHENFCCLIIIAHATLIQRSAHASQENDAEREARAALSIQRALDDINRKNAGSGKPALNARVGIETGPVVVDTAGEVYGDAPNTAARVQALGLSGDRTVNDVA